MKLWSNSFRDGGRIPDQCAFCVIDPHTHARTSDNRNPHLAWDEVPPGTESLALFCIDIDAPTVGTDVNCEGREVPENLARTAFFHWSLIDLPLTVGALREGQLSGAVVAHGKDGPAQELGTANGAVHQVRQGLNDYTGWFASDPNMAGQYFGYDGPCPPWNDLRLHHYLFRLYALDTPRLVLQGNFSGQDAFNAMRGHIIDEAKMVGVYSLHPAVARQLTD